MDDLPIDELCTVVLGYENGRYTEFESSIFKRTVGLLKHGMKERPAYPHWASLDHANMMEEVRRQTGIG